MSVFVLELHHFWSQNHQFISTGGHLGMAFDEDLGVSIQFLDGIKLLSASANWILLHFLGEFIFEISGNCGWIISRDVIYGHTDFEELLSWASFIDHDFCGRYDLLLSASRHHHLLFRWHHLSRAHYLLLLGVSISLSIMRFHRWRSQLTVLLHDDNFFASGLFHATFTSDDILGIELQASPAGALFARALVFVFSLLFRCTALREGSEHHGMSYLCKLF